jgi:protein FrlC
MKLSISTFPYLNYSLDEAIRRIADLGYDGVEIWGGRPHAYCYDIEDAEATGIRKLTEKLGLEISGFIPAQFRYPTCLCSGNPKIRTASVDYIKKSITTAASFGSKKASICPGHTLFGQGYESGMKALAESVEELLEFARKKQVSLLMEPAHPLETDLIVTVDDSIRFIKDYGFKDLGVALDTGHCFINKECLPDCVISLRNIPFHVHIDDNSGQSDDHKVLGEGAICFEPFLQALHREGYDGFLTVELGWGYTAEPDAAAYQCKQACDSLVKRVKAQQGERDA